MVLVGTDRNSDREMSPKTVHETSACILPTYNLSIFFFLSHFIILSQALKKVTEIPLSEQGENPA
jgi:hypothetical protein